MSTYTTGYDNNEGDRYTEVEIDYELEKGGREFPLGVRHCHTYYDIPDQIVVNSVRVMYVEFYNPHGDLLASIKREALNPLVLKHEDDDAMQRIMDQVDSDDCFCELLAGAAG